jgi:signal peptide peptidase SppA
MINDSGMFGHMGLWLADHRYIKAQEAFAAFRDESEEEEGFYVHGGVAIIQIKGLMSKSSIFGSSTVAIRTKIQAALQDEKVLSIFLLIESGGGTVAGTKELADEIALCEKPTVAYIQDIGASAAYWVASQADQVFINEMGEVGSIGVYSVVEDTSELYKKEGVKVHVVSTGDMKGAFEDGVEVTEEMISDLQARIDWLNQKFMAAVSNGRDITMEEVKIIADGRIYDSEKAVSIGLVDGISDMKTVLDSMIEQNDLGLRRQEVLKQLGGFKHE